MKHTIILPDLGQTTNEATIRQLLKKPGDRVHQGEPILAVSTDKVEAEVESFANGYLREWLTSEGAVASAMAPVAIITDSVDEAYERSDQCASPTETRIETGPHRPVASTTTPNDVIAAPAARMLAKNQGLDLSKIPGTGAGGMITKADILRWQAQQNERSSTVNRALKAMAATAVSGKLEIPHFYVTVDLLLEHAATWRRQWNFEHADLHITFNDLFVFSAAGSLRDTPRLNISYAGGSYEQYTAADLFLVVAVEPAMSLVPLADTFGSSLIECVKAIRLAKQIRGSSSARPHLAISNLGMFGVKQFAAIIPPGCTAVLTIGAVRQEAFVRDGKLENHWICSLTLSADHRVVDGVTAARFLERMQFHLNSL